MVVRDVALTTQKKQQGFTLAEIIVVVFILAIATSFLLLRTNLASPTKSAERFSKQLFAYLKVVREQALLQPAVLGVVLTETSYSVLMLEQTEPVTWLPMQNKARFWRPTPISQDVQLTLRMNNRQILIPLAYTPNIEPQIYFMPSGEISDFDLFIEQRGMLEGYVIRGRLSGQLTLEPLEYQSG